MTKMITGCSRKGNHQLRLHQLRLGLLALTLLVANGCGNPGGTVVDSGPDVHLRAVVSLYNYAARQQGRPPKNREDFENFIDSQGTKVLEKLEISSAQDLLISDRDGKEIVVVYGKPLRCESGDIVAYESEGVGGVRNVGFSIGRIQAVDEEEFKKLVP